MKQKAWDVYVNNVMIQRVHYFGYMQMLEQRYRNSGDIVKIVEVEVNC